MKKQITRVSAHQSAKVIAALYVLFFVPFALVGALILMFGNHTGSAFSSIFLLLAPILYGVFGYVFFALFCWLYNIVAQRLGGVEFVVTDMPNE